MMKYVSSRRFDNFRDISSDVDIGTAAGSNASVSRASTVQPLEVTVKQQPPSTPEQKRTWSPSNVTQQVKQVYHQAWFPAAAVGLLYFLTAITLGLALWSLAVANDNHDDINALKSSTSSASGTAAAGVTNSTGQGFTTSDPVILLKTPKAPEGYSFAGSLYRGTGYWAARPSIALGTRRSQFQTVVNGTDVYIFGGVNSTASGVIYLDKAVKFNSLLGLYSDLAPMPETRSVYAAALAGDNIYVIGGYSSVADRANANASTEMLVYSLKSEKWYNAAGPSLPRAAACAATVNGKLYVVGGFAASENDSQAVDTIEVYDPESSGWSIARSLPSGRGFLGCAAANNKLYIAGGISKFKGLTKDAFSDLYVFNPEDNSLNTLAPMPQPRFRFTLITVPDNDRNTDTLMAVGGAKTVEFYDDFYRVGIPEVAQYLPAFDGWVMKAPMESGRWGHAAASLYDGVHVFGGVESCPVSITRCRSMSSVEVYYSADLPEVFVHMQSDASAASKNGITVDVLLSSKHQGQMLGSDGSTFRAAGSLYQGSGYWSRSPDMTMGPLSDLQVVGVPNDTLLYITGGYFNGSASNRTWRYDTLQRTYFAAQNMTEPRYRHASEIVNGKLYVVGGLASETDLASGKTFIYDLQLGTWTTSESELITPRSDACMSAVGGKLYLAGGYSANFTDVLDSVEMYDPATDEWTEEATMPAPRGDVMCGTALGKFIVLGGYYDPSGNWAPNAFRSEVEAYDPDTGEWTHLAPMPVARGDQAVVELPNDRLMVMGGETDDPMGTRTQIATNQVMEYIAVQDMWVMKAPMIEDRFRFDAGFAGDTVLVFGGEASPPEPDAHRPLKTVEAFYYTKNPDIFVWMKEE